MTTFTEVVVARNAEAEAWLAEHKDALVDFDADAETYGQKKGYEVASGTGETETEGRYDPFYLLAKIYVDDGFWQESINEETMLEQGGQYNVISLDRWTKGEGKYENNDPANASQRNRIAVHGARFSREHYDKAQALTTSKRAHFGIEWTQTKKASQTVTQAQKVHKIDQVAKRLTRLQRLAAAAAARKARA
jgi:hypothetical protein